MNWSAFFTTFAAVFLAEMCDKTQLAIFGFASRSISKWTILAASILALVSATIIAVILGNFVGKLIPPVYIKYGSGLLFVVIGLVIMLKR